MATKSAAVNLNVDYVIVYRFSNQNKLTDKTQAQAGFQRLLQTLARVGLAIEVRPGEHGSLLVFVKAISQKRLDAAVYRSRLRDWLHGIRTTQPARLEESSQADYTLPEAERLRIVYQILTSPFNEGGAEITPKYGEWKDVESIFALHDPAFNKEWIKKWSTTSTLKIEQLDDIRNQFGEGVAYYFAFTQSYFSFLFFPAAFGFSCWALLGHFASIYAIVNGLWSVIFIEYWKRQEVDLAIRWDVKGVSAIQERRREFKHEKEDQDSITGETVLVFPETKRLARQLLQIPFAFIAMLALGTVIATCFAIEIFLSEIYNGPFKNYLVFLPTILLTGLIPTLSTLLTGIARRLTDFENYDTVDKYETAMTQKIFVLNFIISYLPVFLTAFVYVPFGSYIVPYLDVFSLTTRSTEASASGSSRTPTKFEINPSRLKQQVIYCAVTAQIVDFGMETIAPYVKRRLFSKYQNLKAERAAKKKGSSVSPAIHDHPEEHEFLDRVRQQASLATYDVTHDLREMVVQFGHLALFSVVWPLTASAFLINNWIELRSDAVKICLETRRPTPHRVDSIGPWIDSLGFLAWLGSLTSAALVYLFRNDSLGPNGTPSDIHGWALLVTIFFSEHIYLLVRWAVQVAISKVDSPSMRKERAERYRNRKRYLETTGAYIDSAVPSPAECEKVSRETLEESARQSSLGSKPSTNQFWNRQRSWEESLQHGLRLIEQLGNDESRKDQ